MDWPQIVWIVLTAIGCGFAIALHGQPRKSVDAGSFLLGQALSAWLLYMGGFFS